MAEFFKHKQQTRTRDGLAEKINEEISCYQIIIPYIDRLKLSESGNRNYQKVKITPV